MVNSEESHLTGFIEQVCKGDEGFSFLQVKDQHSSNERHALNLKHSKHRYQISTENIWCVCFSVCCVATLSLL